MPMRDRRDHKRESLAPFTEIFPEDGGEPISGYPTDMSRGGLALEADAPLPVNSQVSVAVHFDEVSEDVAEGEGPVEFVAAEVRRVEKMGGRHKVSVAFVNLNETDHPILSGVLAFIDE
ncbi:MAG: PilZ domain-containing protein [Nitrospirae bacterium]|nr:PilZ domain-containing protein [Nitrospirota bacterium]